MVPDGERHFCDGRASFAGHIAPNRASLAAGGLSRRGCDDQTMPIVTSIARHRGSTAARPRVVLSLDGEEWLTCGEAIVAEFRLYRGLELPDVELQRLRERVVESEGIAWCLAAVSRRALTEQGLYDRLCERGYDQQVATRLVDRSRELGLVDDGRYARAFAEARLRRGHGARRIVADLHRRGIDRTRADEALRAIAERADGDGKADPTLDACATALTRKFGRSDLDDTATRAKAHRFLLGRGFSHDQAAGAIRELRSAAGRTR